MPQLGVQSPAASPRNNPVAAPAAAANKPQDPPAAHPPAAPAGAGLKFTSYDETHTWVKGKLPRVIHNDRQELASKLWGWHGKKRRTVKAFRHFKKINDGTYGQKVRKPQVHRPYVPLYQNRYQGGLFAPRAAPVQQLPQGYKKMEVGGRPVYFVHESSMAQFNTIADCCSHARKVEKTGLWRKYVLVAYTLDSDNYYNAIASMHEGINTGSKDVGRALLAYLGANFAVGADGKYPAALRAYNGQMGNFQRNQIRTVVGALEQAASRAGQQVLTHTDISA